MSKFLFSNGAKTTVNGSLTQGGTVLVLAFNTGNFFPSPTEGNFFYGTLYEKDLAGIETRIEVVKVINRVADTLTLERDVETLTGQVGGFFYPSGAGATVYFELRVTAGVMQGLVQTADQILALESKSDTDHTHTELYEPKNANIQAHLVSATNPHGVTRAQVGLGNVNNTSDANKPVSTAQAEAIAAAKSQAISAIPTSLPASDVSAWAKEATKPSYTAAEVGAQPVLVSGTNIKTINGTSVIGSGNVNVGGSVNGILKCNGSGTYSAVTSGTDIKTINGASLLGSGNLEVLSALPIVAVSTTTQAMQANKHYVVTTAGAAAALTMPASPTVGARVQISVTNGRTDNSVVVNVSPIQGQANDLFLDAGIPTYEFKYLDSTRGWYL